MFRVKLLVLLTATVFAVFGLFYFQVDQKMTPYFSEKSRQEVRQNRDQVQYFIQAELKRRQLELVSLGQLEANARRFNVDKTRVAQSPSLLHSDLLGVLFFRQKESGAPQPEWVALAPETLKEWSEYFIKKIEQGVDFDTVKEKGIYWQKQVNAQNQTIWLGIQRVYLKDLLGEKGDDEGRGFLVGIYPSDFFALSSLSLKGIPGEYILLSPSKSAVSHSVSGYVSASFDKHPFFEKDFKADSKEDYERTYTEQGKQKLGLVSALVGTNLELLFVGNDLKVNLLQVLFSNRWGVWLICLWMFVLAIGFLLQNTHIDKILVMRRVLINFQNGVYDMAPQWKKTLGDFVPILNTLAQRLMYSGEATKFVVSKNADQETQLKVKNLPLNIPETEDSVEPEPPKKTKSKVTSEIIKEAEDIGAPSEAPTPPVEEVEEEVELTGSGITNVDIKASLLDNEASSEDSESSELPPHLEESASELEKIIQETMTKSQARKELEEEDLDRLTHNGPILDGEVSLFSAVKRGLDNFRDEFDTHSVNVSLTNNLEKPYSVKADVEDVMGPIKSVIQNALDAMAEKDSQRLSIVLDQDDKGPYLSIRDTGVGISQKDLDKIFDPFYTTKEDAEKPGLGLTTAQKSLEGIGGSIEVSSQFGRHTTVVLRFEDPDALGKKVEEVLSEEDDFDDEAFVSTSLPILGGKKPLDDSKTPTPPLPKKSNPSPSAEDSQVFELEEDGDFANEEWKGEFGTGAATVVRASDLDEEDSSALSEDEVEITSSDIEFSSAEVETSSQDEGSEIVEESESEVQMSEPDSAEEEESEDDFEVFIRPPKVR